MSGAVRDSRGRPLTDYEVVVLPQEAVEGPAGTRVTRRFRPDQTGSFRLRGLPPGRYVAAALPRVQEGGVWQAPFAKNFNDAARDEVNRIAGAQPGDTLLFVAEKAKVANTCMGAVRLHIGEKLGLVARTYLEKSPSWTNMSRRSTA